MIPQKRKRGENEVSQEDSNLQPSLKKQKVDNVPSTSKPVVLRKRKVAVMVSYIGTNYRGSQYQDNSSGVHDTIEEELFKAITKAGGISKVNFLGGPKKVGWKRCSRTDKGVHALFNVFSLKLMLGDDQLVNRINENLPEDIFVHGMKRVTGSFLPKQFCSSRTYEYNIPSFMFHRQERLLEKRKMGKLSGPERQSFVDENWKLVTTNVKMSEETFNMVNGLFKHYIGTKYYKSFTKVLKTTKKESLKRYITCCQISKPFMIQDLEFVRVNIIGQSFLIHQIRKMIGLVCAISQGIWSPNIFQTVFHDTQTYRVPMAPGLGLYLRKIGFGPYNRGKGKIHGPLLYEDYEQSILKFEEKLKLHQRKVEREKNTYKKWIAKEVLAMSQWGMCI